MISRENHRRVPTQSDSQHTTRTLYCINGNILSIRVRTEKSATSLSGKTRATSEPIPLTNSTVVGSRDCQNFGAGFATL